MEHSFDHNTANISDKITAIGSLEHCLYHARKGASTREGSEDEVFFQLVAYKCLTLRREYMKEHFPDCPDELWCLGKAVEDARQRIYEADSGLTQDLKEIDAIWAMVWGRITGVDMSGCKSCIDDRPQADISDEDIDAVDAALGH